MIGIQELLGSIPHKPGVAVYAYRLSTLEMGAQGTEELHREFNARPCLYIRTYLLAKMNFDCCCVLHFDSVKNVCKSTHRVDGAVKPLLLTVDIANGVSKQRWAPQVCVLGRGGSTEAVPLLKLKQNQGRLKTEKDGSSSETKTSK